jgi:hypothetical protein
MDRRRTSPMIVACTDVAIGASGSRPGLEQGLAATGRTR